MQVWKLHSSVFKLDSYNVPKHHVPFSLFYCEIVDPIKIPKVQHSYQNILVLCSHSISFAFSRFHISRTPCKYWNCMYYWTCGYQFNLTSGVLSLQMTIKRNYVKKKKKIISSMKMFIFVCELYDKRHTHTIRYYIRLVQWIMTKCWAFTFWR